MKKLLYLFVFLPVFSMLSCSSDDKDEQEFEELNIEIVNNVITSPAWLKKVISDQTITSEKGAFFPGAVYMATILEENYIIVTHIFSSNSCKALQLYHLNGDEVSCDSELHRELFTQGWEKYIVKTVWSDMDTEI